MLEFDQLLEELDLGALEEIEQATGKVMGDLFPDGKMSAAAITALVWWTKHKEDPGFSIDDARKVKLSDLGDEDTGDETSD